SLRYPHLIATAEAAAPAISAGPLGVLLKVYPPVWVEAWRVTRALVRRLRRAVTRDGARFAVVVISGGGEVSERRLAARAFFGKLPRTLFDREKAYRLTTRFLMHRRIPHVGLLPAFRDHLSATGEDGYYRWDPHWNAAGHALAAERIEQGLRDLR